MSDDLSGEDRPAEGRHGSAAARTRAEDAEALLSFIRTVCGETEYLLNSPEEYDSITVEDEAKYLQGINDSPTDMMIVCEINGRIAGNCNLSIKRHIKSRHCGLIGIALYQEFWGRGIGTQLMEALIAVAREKGLRQLELEYMEGNDRGVALYCKMGFEPMCAKQDAIRLKDGRFLKEYTMIKRLV